MPHELQTLWILAIGFSVACGAGYLAQRLKLSPILGYLLAGFIIGPNSPGFTANQEISDQLATIGVTLLMFAVGLNFNWKDINALKKTVVPGAVILSILSILAGIGLSVSLGETVKAGFVVGVAICVSSTVVIVRILTDQHLLRSQQGALVIGWTIIEDLISVFGLILLPSLVYTASSGEFSLSEAIAYPLLIVSLKISALVVIVYFVGERLIEKMLIVIARTRSHELFTLAILACVFLIAVGSAYFFGISIALGAFIAGTVVGKTELSHQAAANAFPMRDAFAVIFFLSVGMLFNPVAVQNNIPLFLGILAILLVFRPLMTFFILKIGKYPSYMAFTVALAISQIGEYSFILAEEGSNLKILPDNAYDIIVACAFISIALNSILFQIFKSWIHPEKRTTNHDMMDLSISTLYRPQSSQTSFLPRAMVIGYGAVGRAAAAYLAGKFQVVVIEQNIDTVSRSKEKNIKFLFGDASQQQLLERANIENMDLVVITTAEAPTTSLIIDSVQRANARAEIISRIKLRSDYKNIKTRNIPIVCDEEAAAEKMVALLKTRALKPLT